MRSMQKYIHQNIYQNIYRIIYQIIHQIVEKGWGGNMRRESFLPQLRAHTFNLRPKDQEIRNK